VVYSDVVYSTGVSSAGPTAPGEILEPFLFYGLTRLMFSIRMSKEVKQLQESFFDFSRDFSAPIHLHHRFAVPSECGVDNSVSTLVPKCREVAFQRQNRLYARPTSGLGNRRSIHC
jgi:hypothetical protein